MRMVFTKMHAQGNDFIIFNGLEHALPNITEEFVCTIAERRFGIGCDQLLLLSETPKADAAMRIFNNDGSEAENCGNGLRCVGDLLMRSLHKQKVSIALRDRTVCAVQTSQGISVSMGSAVITHQSDIRVDVSIGNMHSVFFEAVESFPDDRNIEIINGQIADHVYIDIIERGAGRTPACGSGACATAVAIWVVEGHQRPQHIEMPGGIVRVSGDRENIQLEGEVHTTFTGQVEYPNL